MESPYKTKSILLGSGRVERPEVTAEKKEFMEQMDVKYQEYLAR